MLNEKVKAEIMIREKKCDVNKSIVLTAETEIYEILKGATQRLESKVEDIILQTIGGQTYAVTKDSLHKKLKLRESDHLDPNGIKPKDFVFPKTNELNFDNYIIGFVHKPGRWNGMNFIMSNGMKSNLPQNASYGSGSWTEVRIFPPDAIVKKVIMHGNYQYGGVQFFDRDGNKILEAGRMGNNKLEIILEDNERLLGVRSKLETMSPKMDDLQFVIGRLE